MFLKSMDPKLISHHRNLLFDHRNPRYSHLCRHGSPGVKGLNSGPWKKVVKQMAVTLGNVLLRESGYAALRSQRVAVLANPTAVYADTLEHIVDAMHRDLYAAANASLLAVLSPEHGFRGDHQAEH